MGIGGLIMQDRFRFRVWNKKIKKMYDVKSMSYIDGAIKRIEVQGDIGIAIFDEYGKHIDNCILMQCTGLKDKCGKLIYEGDIIYKKGDKTWNKQKMYSKVIFDDMYASFDISNENGCHRMPTNSNNIEVIGNIYENKELLED